MDRVRARNIIAKYRHYLETNKESKTNTDKIFKNIIKNSNSKVIYIPNDIRDEIDKESIMNRVIISAMYPTSEVRYNIVYRPKERIPIEINSELYNILECEANAFNLLFQEYIDLVIYPMTNMYKSETKRYRIKVPENPKE